MATQILDTLAKISKSYKNAIPYKKYNLSENEYKVLYALSELGAVNSFAYLKEKVKLHDSQISVLLSGLNTKGFVVRKKSDNDRRSVDMNITDEGVQAMKGLKEFLRPEFLNRVDEIITFNHLTEENFRKVSD